MPVAVVLITAGLQVPVILLVDTPGNNGAVEFWHSGPIWVNVGVIWLVITISIVTAAAHWPAVGVNVYVPLAVMLITAGLHVPVILLLEVVGSTGAVLFWHSGPICVNTGVTFGLTVTVNVAVVAHWPTVGVKV